MSNQIPVNVEDCFTAVRALAQGVAELNRKQANSAQFAIIGGVAVAALTRPFINQMPNNVVNFVNIIRRQTQDVDMEIRCAGLDATWNRLNALGYLPQGSDDLISAPGGTFTRSGSDRNPKYLLIRTHDNIGNPRNRNLEAVSFDISELSTSRLLAYMDAAQVFTAASVEQLQFDSLPTALPTFRPHIVLVLKIEGATQREANTKKDYVDIGILVASADRLGFNRASFDPFRTRAAWAQIRQTVASWAASRAKAEQVVTWMQEQKYISPDTDVKRAAEDAWVGYFATLNGFIQ
ncbi:hypothetical protein PUNSTDRAFT_49556 [Punctularia strigosozonata HHB-11173 SS5]|uniref:uncharacterized protein n=1 Tax=Punctularia strigosozonata (strain HHB-11173) TaxID=741275 RepID=UPI0004417FE9|nr:uncharacterized protein PUNSTDRAFT_49556 [Punctularia strigosozonata HHB-11173 SS5]EIN12285.1 hypothetical protein PUNSTDRAFT_49556 [Punctularia strigosozonata HHB-11173 SS5]